jgi:predicted transcriptional regulator
MKEKKTFNHVYLIFKENEGQLEIAESALVTYDFYTGCVESVTEDIDIEDVAGETIYGNISEDRFAKVLPNHKDYSSYIVSGLSKVPMITNMDVLMAGLSFRHNTKEAEYNMFNIIRAQSSLVAYCQTTEMNPKDAIIMGMLRNLSLYANKKDYKVLLEKFGKIKEIIKMRKCDERVEAIVSRMDYVLAGELTLSAVEQVKTITETI